MGHYVWCSEKCNMYMDLKGYVRLGLWTIIILTWICRNPEIQWMCGIYEAVKRTIFVTICSRYLGTYKQIGSCNLTNYWINPNEKKLTSLVIPVDKGQPNYCSTIFVSNYFYQLRIETTSWKYNFIPFFIDRVVDPSSTRPLKRSFEQKYSLNLRPHLLWLSHIVNSFRCLSLLESYVPIWNIAW